MNRAHTLFECMGSFFLYLFPILCYTFMDNAGNQLQAVAFNAADRFTIMPGEFGEVVHANVLIQLDLNEWNGNVSAEGRLIKIDKA